MFKFFRLRRLLLCIGWMLLLAAFALSIYGLSKVGSIDLTLRPVWAAWLALAIVVLGLIARYAQSIPLVRHIWVPIVLVLNGARSLLMLPLCAIAWIHLATVDRLFLRLGKINKLPRPL